MKMKNKELQKKAKYTLELIRLMKKYCDCDECKSKVKINEEEIL